MSESNSQFLERLKVLLKLHGGSRQEQHVVDYIVSQAVQAGLCQDQVAIDNAGKLTGGNTGNLIITLPARQMKAPRRLLMAHMDTVPLCAGAIPVTQGEFLRPQSSQTALGGDNRSGCAVLLNTLISLLTSSVPHPPLTFLWTVQEEIGLVGARYVTKSKLKSPKLCYNFDGGDPLMLITGATGDSHFEITIQGIASHAGVRPEQGVNAMTIASLAISDLHTRGWLGLVEQGKKRGTSNLGVIQGGSATNVVLEKLQIVGEARSHDSQFRERILSEIEKAFRKSVKQVKSSTGKTGSMEMTSRLKYEAFKLPDDDPVVLSAVQACKNLGHTPGLKVSNGGLDANWMTAHGFPTVTLGCGQQNIHTVEEQLHIPAFLQACEIAFALATGI